MRFQPSTAPNSELVGPTRLASLRTWHDAEMLRLSFIIHTVLALGCSRPTPVPPLQSTAKLTRTRDLATASQRFRAALPTGKVSALLAPRVLIENANAQKGCPEPAEPCVKQTLSATDAEQQLVKQIEGFTFAGPETSAEDLGCDVTCCRYGSFVHGDHRVAVSMLCFDDSADPKVNTVVGD